MRKVRTGSVGSNFGCRVRNGLLFFSSRRRHTSCSRDWSSDVCSSDLKVQLNDRSFTVVGVAPREFRGTYPVMDMEAYVPLSAETAEDPDNPVEKIWTSRGYRDRKSVV